MAVVTGRYSWGWRVSTSNNSLVFLCATHAGPYTATLRLGDYTAGQFATEVARAMNAAHPGAGDAFTCVFDFSTRKFTIDNGSRSLTLQVASTALGLLGFNDADTASASGHTSTDTVGNTSAPTYFSDAGVKSWAPVDPAVSFSPVTPGTDTGSSCTTATRLQRHARSVQHETDGGLRETIYYSTDKKFRIRHAMITAAEQLLVDALFDWLETGAPVDFRPDDTAAATVNMRLVMEPTDVAYAFSWLALTNVDLPELTFIQQLSRT